MKVEAHHEICLLLLLFFFFFTIKLYVVLLHSIVNRV